MMNVKKPWEETRALLGETGVSLEYRASSRRVLLASPLPCAWPWV